jgi:hypothetical protein
MFDPDYAQDAFPACRKLGTHRNSHPIWYTPAVLDLLSHPHHGSSWFPASL